MSTEKSYDMLVSLCYESLLDSGAWTRLLEALMQLTGYQQSTLLLWDIDSPAGQVTGINLLNPDTIEPYNTHYCLLDPTHMAMRGRDSGNWYHDRLEMGEIRIAKDTFYQEFFRAHGLGRISCLKLYENERAGCYLSLMNNLDARAPGNEQRALLDRVTPHLVRAGALARHIQLLDLQKCQYAALLDSISRPLWLLSPTGQLSYCNQAAERTMAGSDALLTVSAGRLYCRHQDQRFQGMLAAASGRKGRGKAGLLPLDPGGAQALLVVPASYSPALVQLAVQPSVFVFLVTRQANAALIAELFGLTHAEQRLSILISQGRSPEQCALQLGVSINTVRTQLRSLFQKTGTERQSDLVGLLLSLGL